MSKKNMVNTSWRDINIAGFVSLLLIDVVILSTKNYQTLNWRLQWILMRAGMIYIANGMTYFLFWRKLINKKTLNKDHYKLGDRFVIINTVLSILSFVFIQSLSIYDNLFTAVFIIALFSLFALIFWRGLAASSKLRVRKKMTNSA